MTDILPDILQEGLIVVFCGTAASAKSAQVGAYYGNPTNAFWRALHEVGLTRHQFKPQEFRDLTHARIGLTDVAKKASGNDSDLKSDDFDGAELTEKIKVYQPNILAFTSKRAYRAWRGLSASKQVSYGFQDDLIGKTRIFVLPSPSGAARGYWDISHWQILADAYQQLRNQHGNLD